MIKDIAFHLPTRANDTATVDFAISVAGALEAHIAAIAFALDPFIPPAMGLGDAIPVAWLEEQRQEAKSDAAAAIARFEEAGRRNGVACESRTLDTNLAGAANAFGEIARCFDLSVVRQPEPGKEPIDDLIVEGALFGSGRPVLVVPYIQKAALKLDRVMIGWDGSYNAARAVGDAAPLLALAKMVEVVIVLGEAGKRDEIPGADIGGHLARHGLKVEVKRIVAVGSDVPDTMLSHAADTGTDFLVMGGYGHSRLREFVLGGVTRGILKSMTVPVLMSH